MASTLKKQALTLTIANTYTRALGFALRLISARLMGAEAMGVMELSGSAVMLAITPVTAGVPTAMSRLTARRDADGRAVLAAGLSLIRRLSLLLIPLLLALSPLMAWLLGDWRTLPAILTCAPTVLLLGLCAVYSGWFYGRSDMRTPALCECAEQTVRCVLCLTLLLALSGRSIAVTAALPGVAEIAAGVVVWLLFRRAARGPHSQVSPALRSQLLRLSAPITASRLCQTAMRALNAVLLPVCLRCSGLTQAAAVAQYGLLNGMVMPLLMLPGIVTSAVSMVATPAISRQEGRPQQLRRTMRRLLLGCGGAGLAIALLLLAGADFIGDRLYGEPDLAPLLRLMSPAALLSALLQVQFGLIAGLGLQRRALTATIAGSALTLVVTAALCPLPGLRIRGAAIASIAASLMRVIWNQILLHRTIAVLPIAKAGSV